MFLLSVDRYSLDEFGKARRSAVVRGFIDALTRGGGLLQLIKKKFFFKHIKILIKMDCCLCANDLLDNFQFDLQRKEYKHCSF